MALLDASGDPIRPPKRMKMNGGGPQAQFLRGLEDATLWAWSPALREPAFEYQQARSQVTTRAINAQQNSGWIAGGIEQATAAIAGPFLALNARPDPAVFRDDERLAAEWSRKVERRYEVWARSPYACDLMGRHNLGQMCKRAVTSWFTDGEIVGLVRYKKRPGNTHGTKIQVLPSTRIPETARNLDPPSTQGVVLDDDGAPIAYWFTTIDPVTGQDRGEQLVRARDDFGRPVVIHIHDSPATVARGISRLAPSLKLVRQYDQLADATLVAALLQTICTVAVKSDLPTDEVRDLFQSPDEQATGESGVSADMNRFLAAREQWYKDTRIDLNKVGKILHLFAGDELEFLQSKHPNENYKSFARQILLEVSRCLGITYEQMTGDRERATYSSERMGSSENWLICLDRRQHIAGRFMQICYEAWLEEDIELGHTQVPGGMPAFLANRDAFCRADWRGPPRPTADELKAARANEIKLKNKLVTREALCAEDGADWQDVDDQLKREQENAAKLGIDTSPAGGGGSSSGGGSDGSYEPDQNLDEAA